VPRESLSTRIGSLGLSKAKAYADFLRDGDPDGPVPCWGAITSRFVESFFTDEERLAVLDQLIEEATAARCCSSSTPAGSARSCSRRCASGPPSCP